MAPDVFGEERVALARGWIEDVSVAEGRLAPSAGNLLRAEYANTDEGRETRRQFASYPPEDRVRLRLPRLARDPERPGDLLVLKAFDPATGEKGVIAVHYNVAILALPAVFDLPAMAREYAFLLEPSTWGYQDSRFLLWLGSDLDVVVEAQCEPDFAFVRDLWSNLTPVRLGAGDWVDPETFHPKPGPARTYDVVMVSAWDRLKRHDLLFRTLRRIRDEDGRRLKAALVGYPLGWTRRPVERRMRRRGVEADCTVFERVPHSEVARIVADSRVSVLLSKREGANRAIYESMFCGTPVVVHRHHRGVNLDQVVPEVGCLADDDELPDAIRTVVDGRRPFDPRGWALAHTGYENATRAAEDVLRGLSERRGLPWTRGLARKKGVRYAVPGAYAGFAAEYERLKRFLLPAE